MEPGYGWFLTLIAAPFIGYVGIYLCFRCWGKLRVNAEGWHASAIFAGPRVVLSALRLFGVFQPLLRFESGLFRKLGTLFRPDSSREPPVSEVVVELVRF